MPIVISRTPYRVSFFGGGSDYPAWYRREGGAVLSTSIDKYCYLSCRQLPPFFNIRHRVIWKHIEQVNSISEILHPAVREGLWHLGFDDSVGLEIQYQGDLPARAGMGSSSSFAVGLINALLTLRGEQTSKRDLALRAIELEQDVMKDSVGSQDQVAAAYGGFNIIRFQQDGDIDVEPVEISAARTRELESHLMLFYTGASRLGGAVARSIIENLPAREAAIREMRALVDIAHDIVAEGDLNDFGRLLHESWRLKRSLSARVSSSVVDEIYETARAAGAVGGKLLGAGGSGFMLFFTAPERRDEARHALRHFLHVPFRFERTGASLIHNSEMGGMMDDVVVH